MQSETMIPKVWSWLNSGISNGGWGLVRSYIINIYITNTSIYKRLNNGIIAMKKYLEIIKAIPLYT